MSNPKVVDLRGIKADTDVEMIDIFDGIACRGKIESYGNAGIPQGEKVKICLMQITVAIPQTDVPRFMAMEDNNNMVELLVQPMPKKRPGAEADPPEDDSML